MPSLAIAPPPILHEGDRMDTAEFISRWEAMPDLKHAELLNGTVFMSSPVALDHGAYHTDIGGLFSYYTAHTEGCDCGADSTWLMGPSDSPQPDVFLRLLPSHGGQSRNEGKYAGGAPELIAEVSGSSLSRDHGVKLELYQRCGVREYITIELPTRTIVWRQLVRGKYHPIQPDVDGLLRSRAFPGLWIDPESLWKRQWPAAVQRGLASPEHAAFVKKLAAAAVRKARR